MKFEINDEVFWTIPGDNLPIGYYKIIKIIGDVYTISKGLTQIKVTEQELS